ncbi:MAG: HAD-IIA family hydrolase [Chloroflexia bacterium]|nr:HAD-IIA family hydrolase [Chloroflexia bacterium]
MGAVREREAGRTALDRLRAAKGVVFDMDGVLYVGSRQLPGVRELLDALALRDTRIMLATNNSMSTPEQYVERLAAMGIAVPPEAILTSALATRDYLLRTLPEGSGVFVIGMPALRAQLFADAPFYPVQYGEEQPAALVVGLDRTFDYEKLLAAHAAVRGGARFVATNADATLPTEAGLVPGAGAIVAAIQTCTGQEPVVIGKPGPLLLEMAALRMGIAPGEAVMVGDRLDTDILAGARAGMATALVLTGVSTRDEIAGAAAKPDLVVNDLPALTAALVG